MNKINTDVQVPKITPGNTIKENSTQVRLDTKHKT